MKALRLLMVLSVFAVIAACASPQPAAAPDLTPITDRLSAVEQKLDSMDERISALEGKVDELAARPMQVTRPMAAEDLAAAVKRAEDAASRAENAAKKSEKAFEMKQVK